MENGVQKEGQYFGWWYALLNHASIFDQSNTNSFCQPSHCKLYRASFSSILLPPFLHGISSAAFLTLTLLQRLSWARNTAILFHRHLTLFVKISSTHGRMSATQKVLWGPTTPFSPSLTVPRWLTNELFCFQLVVVVKTVFCSIECVLY